jgi:hypothetical protein
VEGEEPAKCWFQKMLVPKLLQYFAKFCPKIMQNVETFIHFFIYLIVIHFVGLELLTSNLKEFFIFCFFHFPKTNVPKQIYQICTPAVVSRGIMVQAPYHMTSGPVKRHVVLR